MIKFYRIKEYASEYGMSKYGVAEMIYNIYVNHCSRELSNIPPPDKILENPERYYVMTDAEEVIGVGAVDIRNGTIMRICIKKEERGRGYGRVLLAFLTSVALEHGVTPTICVHNDNLIMRKLVEDAFKKVRTTKNSTCYRLDLEGVLRKMLPT